MRDGLEITTQYRYHTSHDDTEESEVIRNHNRDLNNKKKSICINGKEYESASQASLCTGIGLGTLHKAVKKLNKSGLKEITVDLSVKQPFTFKKVEGP